jgi:DNA-binding SARP family transcriptional activator
MLFAVKEYEEAADCFRQVIALDEYFEVAHRQLMRCFARQGERSQALRHYHNLVVLRQNELGVPPASQTTEIYTRLRQGEDI